MDPQVDWAISPALHDEGVIAGAFQFVAEEASDLTLGDAARERRLGADGVARAARHRRTGHGAKREYEYVIWGQGIRTGLEFFQQIVGDEPCAAHISAVKHLIGFVH
jgi:hypothetical protein